MFSAFINFMQFVGDEKLTQALSLLNGGKLKPFTQGKGFEGSFTLQTGAGIYRRLSKSFYNTRWRVICFDLFDFGLDFRTECFPVCTY